MKKYYLVRAVTLFFTVATAVMIFGFSAETATISSASSRSLLRFLFTTFYPGFSGMTPQEQMSLILSLHGGVRTLAHFSEYVALGFFFFLFLSTFSQSIKKRAAIAAALCFLYAIFDEIHQLFVPGRSFEVTDILTDTIGVLFAISLLSLFFRSRNGDRLWKKLK